MIIPSGIPLYGDVDYRGACPSETAEQMTFFNRVRRDGCEIALHIKNEGKRINIDFDKANGLTTGASDIIIPGAPTFVCELKRRDHTQSRISKKQISYLRQSANYGAFVCIALGCDAAYTAYQEWLKLIKSRPI